MLTNIFARYTKFLQHKVILAHPNINRVKSEFISLCIALRYEETNIPRLDLSRLSDDDTSELPTPQTQIRRTTNLKTEVEDSVTKQTTIHCQNSSAHLRIYSRLYKFFRSTIPEKLSAFVQR